MKQRKTVSPLLVRLPTELKAWLLEHAKENSRDMTGEIIQLIKAERSRTNNKGKCHV